MSLTHRLVLPLLLTLAACGGSVTPVDDRNSTLTQGAVQMTLVVGETTKADVLKVFGAPNVTTRDGTGQEIWSYQRAATAAQTTAAAARSRFLIDLGVGGTGTSQTSRMTTLIITFDANDVVSDFKSRTSTF